MNKSSVGLLIASILIPIAAMEYFLRWKYDRAPGAGENRSASCADYEGYFEKECYGLFDNYAFMKFYSKAGYRPMENWQGAGVRTNDFGARSDRNLADLRAKELILYTGGSTAFGSGVKQSDLYTEAANKMGEKHLHVAAGVGGYVFSNELDYFKDYLRFTTPRKWVAFTGWNDVYAYYRGNDYYRSPDMLNLSGIVAKANYDYAYNRYMPSRESADYAFSPQSYEFKLHWLLRRAFHKIQHRSDSDMEPYVESKWIPKGYEDFWTQFRLNLLMADRISRELKIEFLVAVQPSLYNTRKVLSAKEVRMLESYKVRFPDLERHFKAFYPRLVSDIKALCASNDMKCVDVDEAISAEKETLFVDHVHFGSKGHKLIGDFFFRTLTRSVN